MKPLVLAIVGPTASGKTALAIALSKHFGTPIISADSRQFYREMTIGTAAPTKAEQIEARHYFVHHLSIFDAYDVGAYQQDALRLIERIHRRTDIAILCGGSGLYVDAVLQGLHSFPEVPEEIRQRWSKLGQQEGLNVLQEELRRLDPDYFQRVDANNPHRLIRALSVCEAGGRPYSSYLSEKLPDRPFDYLYLRVGGPREIIYNRIERRVDDMMVKGLLEEAKSLYPYKNLNPLQAVGYQELFQYLEGRYGLEQAIDEIKKNTRRFAKRQLTWYRNRANCLDVPHDEEYKAVARRIESKLR